MNTLQAAANDECVPAPNPIQEYVNSLAPGFFVLVGLIALIVFLVVVVNHKPGGKGKGNHR